MNFHIFQSILYPDPKGRNYTDPVNRSGSTYLFIRQNILSYFFIIVIFLRARICNSETKNYNTLTTVFGVMTRPERSCE